MLNITKVIHFIADILIITILVWIDQYTKKLAVIHLKDKPDYILIDKVFELSYLENRGAAFGVFQNKQVMFLIISSVFVIIITYLLYKLPIGKKYIFAEISLVLLFAGAIGNMIDRVVNNYVVDFFYFVLINFPVFNVADIYVTVSSIVLFILIVFVYSEDDLTFIKLKNKNNE